MQYILSQEEMDELKRKADQNKYMPSVKKLQEFCTMVADTLVLTKGWAKGKPWRCIITMKNEHHEWYCDECPAREICPYQFKHYSK